MHRPKDAKVRAFVLFWPLLRYKIPAHEYEQSGYVIQESTRKEKWNLRFWFTGSSLPLIEKWKKHLISSSIHFPNNSCFWCRFVSPFAHRCSSAINALYFCIQCSRHFRRCRFPSSPAPRRLSSCSATKRTPASASGSS